VEWISDSGSQVKHYVTYPFDQHPKGSECQKGKVQLQVGTLGQKRESSMIIDSIARPPTFRRNLLSSFETSAESHNHPFHLLDGVDDTTATTEGAFSAIFQSI
jgi:hypothetical protein